MFDSQQNSAGKYQQPQVVLLDIPADLHQALSDGNVEEARKIFFRLLTETKWAELKNLIDNITAMLKQYKLALDATRVFSLKVMHDELLKKLRICFDDNARIALLENNQWLEVFGNKNDVTSLRSCMREYELALRAKKTQKESADSIVIRLVALTIIFVLSYLFLKGMSLGPWITPLVSTQIACIALAIFSRTIQETAHSASAKYARELESFTAEYTVNLTTDSLQEEESFEKDQLLKEFDALLSRLNIININNLSMLDFIEQNKKLLDGLKTSDHDAYTKIYNTLNDLEIARKYHNSEQITSHIGLCYVILSIALTSLVALSIGLTHTHKGSLLFGGVSLGIYLGILALIGAKEMLDTYIKPCINEDFKRDKITELSKIRSNLENKLNDQPLLPPPGNSNACYAPQAGGGMHFKYVPDTPSAPPYEQPKNNPYGPPALVKL